ncbi:MAG: hydantoinase/oxoprolinase family protein [Chloroflexi bacterium]|nr:hydantoinase/oxoprolinase family protein [Chloroflexota bacterium]
MQNKTEYNIGVDTGGTFTDVIVIGSDGNTTIGKAETTPGKLEEGVLNALADAAGKLGLSRQELLRSAASLVQGTTIGTNILINRDGVKTGMITTKGFEDTTHIMRAIGRIDGLSPEETRHAAMVKKPIPIVPKRLIRGVAERIDSFGNVVVPLNVKEVENATTELIDEGVEAIAICFLWSHLNPKHELEAFEIVSRLAPKAYVDVSHKVAPLIREYGRFNTAAIDCYIGPIMVDWYRKLDGVLRSEGFGKELLTAQVWGGVMPYKEMLPIGTINSGPVGGVIGSRRIATDLLGLPNVVTTDVGGTSFDVSVIAEGRHVYAREKPIMRFRVNIPMIDVTSIGAGGGTIAWVDAAGALKVGPMSAGADPGPVCYMKGGTEPTVTDAALVLGLFDPDFYLGGRKKLNKEAAFNSVKGVADKLGMDVTETAAAIFDIQNEHMIDLLRLMVTRTGYDPRDFAVFCFGGGGPTHGAVYGKALGFKGIYMFPASSVWSAFGLASADVSRIFDRSTFLRMPVDPGEFNKVCNELESRAMEEMTRFGFKPEDVVLTREVSMKFGRQVNVERIPIPSKTYTGEDLDQICNDFVEFYRSVYGEGAAFVEAGMEAMAFHVTATLPLVRPSLVKYPLGSADASHALKGKRDVHWQERGYVPTNVYDGERLQPGNVIPGPAIAELPTTTILVPYDSELRMDEYGFFVLV